MPDRTITRKRHSLLRQGQPHNTPQPTNPAPQWIVVLSGRWFIESMDGTRVEQGPGEFSFGEDQGCAEVNGKKGHRSGTIGNEPAVLMTVQLHVPPTREPCHIK